jgi:uncharacterized protein (DUF427 family)
MALDLAAHVFAALPELRVHPTGKRIRALVAGAVVVDSTRARIVWEPQRIVPSYAVPVTDIVGTLVPSGADAPADVRPVTLGAGPAVLDPGTGFSFHTTPGAAFDIAAGPCTLRGAAFVPDDPDLGGVAVLDFDAFDEWREEDDILLGHARDPFKTVDTRHSTRRVVVELGGVVLADSGRPVMLFETHLPTRYYLPRDDVRMHLLTPTSTTTVCAYKGRARYWSATVGADTVPDVAWTYERPDNGATAVQDMVCFFDERVDVVVDGARQERPSTPWS